MVLAVLLDRITTSSHSEVLRWFIRSFGEAIDTQWFDRMRSYFCQEKVVVLAEFCLRSALRSMAADC